MKFSLLAAVAAVVFVSGAAHATTTLSFTSFGTVLTSGEVLVTDFSSSAVLPGFTLSGTGSFLTGTSGFGAAPAFDATQGDTGQYLSIEGNRSETLTTPMLSQISFYVGSLDSYNGITFTHAGGATETFTGDDLAALTGAVDNGAQQSVDSNGRFTFTFSTPITSVLLYSTDYSFEVADIGAGPRVDQTMTSGSGVGGVPEPASWAMMLVGFGGLGGLLRHRRRAGVVAA